MKFINLALTALSSIAVLANPLPDPLLGKRILPPKWHVQVTPGGQRVIIEGTVQQVRSELLRLNPRYLQDFPPGPEPTRLFTHPMAPVLPPGPNTAARSTGGGDGDDGKAVEVRAVEGRDTNFGGGSYFCGGYRMANWGHIREGLDSFSHIADGARDVGNVCAWMETDGVQKVTGQIFHPDGWNVLIRGDTSHC